MAGISITMKSQDSSNQRRNPTDPNRRPTWIAEVRWKPDAFGLVLQSYCPIQEDLLT